MADKESFIISNKKDIVSKLKSLIKNKQMISVIVEQQSFISAVVAVDPKSNMMVLDYGANENLNKQLVKLPHVMFETDFSGIKVHFTCSNISIKNFKGAPAFIMPIPDSIYWEQRRKFYRIKSPLSKTSYCEFEWKPEKRVKLRLFDISLSGFSMMYDLSKASEPLKVPSNYENCRLVLEEQGQGKVSFTICNQFPINPEKPDKLQKVGCKFTDLKPAFESTIQRYMQQVERESRQKE